MEIKRYQAALEAILFANGEPISVEKLAAALEMENEDVERLADDLAQEYRTRNGGLAIVKLDDCYQMCTKRDFAPYVRLAMEIRRNTPLSQAAMEVLAIVAYNQPVTKAVIEQVRGVDCGAVMQGLQFKGLIEEKGRLELPGRPLLYGTTVHFLRCFGVSSLEELPPLPQKGGDEEMEEPTLDDMIRENEALSAGDEKAV